MVTVPSAATLRIWWLLYSLTNRLPLASRSTPEGRKNFAAAPLPSTLPCTWPANVSTSTAVPVTQVPPEQASPKLQTLPSSQAVVLLALAHLPAMQLSVVHGLLSLQSLAWVQLPPQPTIGAWLHWPVPALQASCEQASWSSQSAAAPSHTPAVHESLSVQGLPSAQGAASASVVQAVALTAGLQIWHELPGLGAPAT